MAKLVTIYGGSGFVGRYVARRMAKQGWRVRVATRRPNETMFVRTFGVAGQVEPVLCNVRDDASVRAAMQGADAVVNCAGILVPFGKNRFDAVHQHGAGLIASIAAEENVSQLVHFSAIGADLDSDSDYAKSKAEGEVAVRENFPGAVILRPSVIFGTEDGFFNKFAKMAKLGPVLGLVGAETKFQPVYVDDIARATVACVLGQAKSGVYELGGPEVKTLRELIQQMLVEIRLRRLILNVPFGVGSVLAGVLDLTQKASLGLFTNTLVTRDQVRLLRHDNVVSKGARTFKHLGIHPVALQSVLGDYLWPYRPAGQFAAIKESADNLPG